MRCALFFGSFNPIHYGHLSIAEYLLGMEDIEQVRLILSPKNPLKDPRIISDPYIRFKETVEAVNALPIKDEFRSKILVSDVEFHLSPPLYTINTLRYLREQEPENEHILIIGGDNISIIEKWYKWEDILNEFEVWVYPRNSVGEEELCTKYNALQKTKKVLYLSDAPLYDISSSEIREGKKSQFTLPG